MNATVYPTPPWIPAGAYWRGEPGHSALFSADHQLIRYWFDANHQPQPERRRVPCQAIGCSGTVLE